MKSTKIEKTEPGHYRETKTFDNGVQRVEEYTLGVVTRNTESVEYIQPSKDDGSSKQKS